MKQSKILKAFRCTA